jgi:multicomponent Na+:H+ antiporter subunit F
MIFTFAYILLALGFVFALYRLVTGPSIFDRVISLDLVSSLLMCGLGIYSVQTRQFVFIDVILAIALIAFLGTVAFARYLDREMKLRETNGDTPEPGQDQIRPANTTGNAADSPPASS